MIDFLIIGQGLSGSLLAWELIQHGRSVVIVDNGVENASQVAAGLINPVTGMRLVKSPNVELLLTTARSCYSDLEVFFHQEFFRGKPMLRIFKSAKELNEAKKRVTNPEYAGYINNIQSKENHIGNLATPYGYMEQNQTGYLLTRLMLDCLKTFFISRNCCRQASIEYRDIQLEPTLHWQDIYPKQVIFCEGYHATLNPWFSWLPFQPVKGEILTLQHETILPDKILNYGNWLIPLSSNQIRIGATFDRVNLDIHATEVGKNMLLDEVRKLSPNLGNSIITNHQANIRPCTLDRNPFIGHHPVCNQLGIFNGFGAKGSLQIPWYSKHFANNLLEGNPLSSTCNINRYYHKYFIGS